VSSCPAGEAAADYVDSKWPVIQHSSVAEMPLHCLDATTHLYTFWDGWNPHDRKELVARVNASRQLKVCTAHMGVLLACAMHFFMNLHSTILQGLAIVQRGGTNMETGIEDAGRGG
jgi:hypothetical protein